jgi:hypothetical protein
MILNSCSYFLMSCTPAPLFSGILMAQETPVDVKEIYTTSRTFLLMMNMFVAIFLLFVLMFILLKYRSFKKKNKRAMKLDLTSEELKALYGDDMPVEIGNLEKLSREELRIIAEKELEKQGLKPGERDYLKGPLDWDDLDENFRPRPKVIRSEISGMDNSKISDKYKDTEKQAGEESKSEKDELSSPPNDVLE